MSIARYYDESENEDRWFMAGVPLRDITQEEWDALPEYLKRSVDAVPIYRKTPPPKSKPDKEETP